jgi:hypothetical protein
MAKLHSRLRHARVKTCPLCGNGLQLVSQQKYDPFWIVLLILTGAIFAFYLVGIAVMAVGLTLLRKQQGTWVCPGCASKKQTSLA